MSIIIGAPMTCLPTTELAQLRADLATVTAESAERGKALEVWRAKCAEERAAHAETRKALKESLEAYDADHAEHRAEVTRLFAELGSTRAELAKAEARVKELEAQQPWSGIDV